MKKTINKQTTESPSEGFDGQIRFIKNTGFTLFAFFLLLIFFYWVMFSRNGWSNDPESWGQFGDFLGGVLNPLVSLTALLALVVSMYMQRTELSNTRAELLEARKVAIEQAKTSEQQRREQRFFDLLNLYQNTSEALSYSCNINSNITLTFNGKAAISEWLLSSNSGKKLNFFNTQGFGNYPLENPSVISKKTLESIWRSHVVSDFISPYIRIVFNILAEADSILGEDQERYISFFRNQLSNSELFVLCYHIYLDSDIEKSRYLAERYELLKHLPQGKLREETEKILSLNVFGKQKVLI